jgi:hypothetical protein
MELSLMRQLLLQERNMRQISKITGRSYYPEDACIILNVAQVVAYLKNGASLLDIYVGKGDKLCFVFPKDKFTKQLFERWNNYEL